MFLLPSLGQRYHISFLVVPSVCHLFDLPGTSRSNAIKNWSHKVKMSVLVPVLLLGTIKLMSGTRQRKEIDCHIQTQSGSRKRIYAHIIASLALNVSAEVKQLHLITYLFWWCFIVEVSARQHVILYRYHSVTEPLRRINFIWFWWLTKPRGKIALSRYVITWNELDRGNMSRFT